MSAGRSGVLRRLTERVSRTSDELYSDDLKRESSDLGALHIADLQPRTLATVSGEVRAVTLRPRNDVAALDVEVWDGTEALHLVWLGRRRIAGITPGIKIAATGRITQQRGVLTIYNPAYEILVRSGPSHD